jgi:predicted RNase H-like HicB family nuclease
MVGAYSLSMRELVFEVTQEEDGGFCAKSIGEGIYTQGDTWEELREMVLDATKGYFYDSVLPERIRLHLLRDEVLTLRDDTLVAA